MNRTKTFEENRRAFEVARENPASGGVPWSIVGGADSRTQGDLFHPLPRRSSANLNPSTELSAMRIPRRSAPRFSANFDRRWPGTSPGMCEPPTRVMVE